MKQKLKNHPLKHLLLLIGVGLIVIGGVIVANRMIYLASAKPVEETTTAQSSDASTTEKIPKAETSQKEADIAASSTTASKTTPATAPKESAAPTVALQKPSASNPVVTGASPRGMALYVSPVDPKRQVEIASQPVATWLGGWSGNVEQAANAVVSAATSQGKLATLVAYNIPVRDCGSYSAGGANSSEGYKTWIRQMANGIGDRQAIVILEPDALAQLDCLSMADQKTRIANLADAVSVLAHQTRAFVYLDAGHSAWIGASVMASRLQQANVAQARGFSLNVSNFQTTTSNTQYGNAIANIINKKFVIDTSRNGNGPNGEWCNPSGRALGERPTTNAPGNTDAYLWVKVPGESDGTCNGGPAAGVWWPEYAAELVN